MSADQTLIPTPGEWGIMAFLAVNLTVLILLWLERRFDRERREAEQREAE